MKTCTIYCAKNDAKASDTKLKSYLQFLTPEQQERNRKFVRWQDKQANLYGKMLLLHAAKNYGFDIDILKHLKTNKHGRPYYDESFDYNITHAGNYVLCATTTETKVGIDIEPVRKIELSDFRSTMNDSQWLEIVNSGYSYKKFFEYWTKKESVIKADGRGLSIPLDKIVFVDNSALFEDKVWYLNGIPLDDRHLTYLACNDHCIDIKINWISLG